MADKPVHEVVSVDAALDALVSPTSSDVYEAVDPFSDQAVAAVAAKRALDGGGGGGSQTFRGAQVYLNTNQTVGNGEIFFDDPSGAATAFDTDGFMNQNQGHFIIPAGLDGLYLIEGIFYFTGNAAMLGLVVVVHEPSDSCDIHPAYKPGQSAADDPPGALVGSGCWIRELAAGNSVRATVTKSAPSQVIVEGDGSNATRLSIQYLGPLAS